MKLSKLLKKNQMLDEKHILKLVEYANDDLPFLESRFQTLSNDVIDLQWRKKDCQNELAGLGSAISEQRKSLNMLQMAVEYKKQMSAEWDRKLNA